MKNMTMTSTTQITRVRPAFPLVADRNLSADLRRAADARVGSYASKPMTSDVASFRCGRPPV